MIVSRFRPTSLSQSVISDILDFTKAENRMLEFIPRPVNLHSIIRKSVALFAERAGVAKKKVIYTENPDDVMFLPILVEFWYVASLCRR